MTRYRLLDSCRGLAAMTVLLYHVGRISGHDSGFFGHLDEGLGIGVPIFFLLSGFLLYRPFVSARVKGTDVDVRRFAVRRLLRIVPAYWVALTLLTMSGAISGAFSGDWWRYYGFSQVYSASTLGGGMGVAWTLCVELTFYALLPLYALATARLGPRHEVVLLAALAGVSLAFRAVVIHNNWAYTLPGTFIWFVPGMMLALLSTSVPGRLAVWGSDRAIACWSLALALFVVHSEWAGPVTDTALAALIAFLFVLPAVFPGGQIPHRLLNIGPLMWIGTISYAIYLYHATLMAWLYSHGATGWVPLAVVTIAVTIPVAAASWYLLERPILNLKPRRRSVGRRAAEPSQAIVVPASEASK
jgi:peptidoglycan/LPS O-acetylase OafA/YrhL